VAEGGVDPIAVIGNVGWRKTARTMADAAQDREAYRIEPRIQFTTSKRDVPERWQRRVSAA
jgi:hypothetical protein